MRDRSRPQINLRRLHRIPQVFPKNTANLIVKNNTECRLPVSTSRSLHQDVRMAPPRSTAQKAPCYVLGVGMTKFIKPRGKVDYTELGYEAGVKAMLDAQINYDDVEAGVACYCYGDSTCG